MKVPDKSKDKKGKVKLKHIPKSKKEQVLIVAQEIKFARLLSGNEKKTRDRVLKSLKKWLLNCFEKSYEFKEDDFVRVWKGLFYAVWMSDKPLIQEELCDNIAGVLDIFPADQLKYAVLMTKAGFKVLATEWYGIDHHRMDKFLMLVRRYLRGSLRALARCKWRLKCCQIYSKMLSSNDGIFAVKTPHYARNALSLQMHIVDCYLEELAKVSEGSIPDGSLVALLRPFCEYMCGGEAPALCIATRRLLTALVRQSDLGLRYQHATDAWKQMGCPEGGPEALELVVDEDAPDEGNDNDSDQEAHGSEKVLDPRAGRVDVELPCLPVPAAMMVELLRSLMPSTASKAHKRVKICLQRFEQLARDEYPLPVRAPSPETEEVVVNPREAASSLHALEKKLIASSDELALRGLSRKHRKRLLAKSRAGANIVEELDKIKQSADTNSNTGGWQVESTEPISKKPKKDTSNKENRKKRKRDKTDADANKKPKMNGDATHKLQKIDPSLDKNKKSEKIAQNGIEKRNKKIDRKDKVAKLNDSKNKSVKTNKVDVTSVETNIKDATSDKTKTKKHMTKTKNNENTVLKENTKQERVTKAKTPTVLVNKVKHFQKQSKSVQMDKKYESPKKVKFVLKNNCMQGPVDYYKSVRQSPNIPYDSSKKPCKTNLKPSTPSPINPFFKKKLKMK